MARVSALAVSRPHGGVVISGSWDRTVGIWNVSTGKAVKFLEDGHSDEVSAVAYGHGQAVSVGQDRQVCLWDCRAAKLVQKHPAGVGGITTMCPLNDHGAEGDDLSVVITGSDSGTVVAVDTRTGDVVRSFDIAGSDGETVHEGARVGRPGQDGLEGTVRSLLVKDGYVYVGTSGDILVFDFDSGAEITKLKGHDSAVSGLVEGVNGHFFSCGWDGYIREWDTRTFMPTENYLLNLSVLFSCMVVNHAPKGASTEQVLHIGGDDEIMRTWKPNLVQRESQPEPLPEVREVVPEAPNAAGANVTEMNDSASKEGSEEVKCEAGEQGKEEASDHPMDEISVYLRGAMLAAREKGDHEEIQRVGKLIAEHYRVMGLHLSAPN